ncbi:hypothetical protein POKO110462_02285 [Pontibacter korlensis]
MNLANNDIYIGSYNPHKQNVSPAELPTGEAFINLVSHSNMKAS